VKTSAFAGFYCPNFQVIPVRYRVRMAVTWRADARLFLLA